MSELIAVKNVSVQFSGCDALRGVDLSVSAGQVVALLGENGAGKTTLIRVLTGFLTPTTGTCQVLGLDPQRDSLEIRRRVGYVSDAPALYDWMRVAEIGWFASSFYDAAYLPRYRDVIDRYEVPQQRKIRQLSKGHRAKVALALALAHDPELLILDEPTSGLDPIVRRSFMESMLDRAATGKSVLLSSHQIAEVERVADVVAILHEGRFRVTAPLDELRDSVSEIVFTVEDPFIALPEFDAPTTTLMCQSDGRQRRMIVRHFNEAARELLADRPGVTNIRARSATLDELFVAYTREYREIRANDGRIEAEQHV